MCTISYVIRRTRLSDIIGQVRLLTGRNWQSPGQNSAESSKKDENSRQLMYNNLLLQNKILKTAANRLAVE